MIPYYSYDDLAELNITTREVIQSIEKTIQNIKDHSAWSASKAVIQPGDGRYMMAALAAMDDPDLLAVKTLVLNPDNSEKGLDQINGLVTMLDSQTGLPKAIMDANWITAIRTAGLSAVAAKYLARKDSKTVAFIGCGVQARSHLKAFSDMFDLKEIKILGRGQKNIDRLSDYAATFSLSSKVFDSGEDVLKDSDLIVSSVTYTGEMKPFLNAEWIKPGAFAAITDLAAPWDKNSFFNFNPLIIDDLVQEKSLPNKLAPEDSIHGDLSQLVLGETPTRTRDKQRTAFIFRGHAVGDLALSVLAYQKANPT